MSDIVYELVITIGSNQFSQTDREAYIQFDDENFGFLAPIIGGAAYLKAGDGLSRNGIPLQILIDALKNGDVHFYSSIYDPVGRKLYDMPIWIRYRTWNDYDIELQNAYYQDSSWPNYFTDYYPWNYATGTVYSRSFSRVPSKSFRKFPQHRQRWGQDRMRASGSYGRFKMGNFSQTNRSHFVSQKSGSSRGGRRK